MGLVNELFSIPISQYVSTLALSLNYEQFYVKANSGRVVFTDEDIKADADGRYMIDLSPLGIGIKQTEVPKEVMEMREKARRDRDFRKNLIYIDRSTTPSLHFFFEDGKLRVLQGDNQIIGEVETIYGKPVVKSEGLGLDDPYIVLPAEVVQKFEGILKKKEIEKTISKLTLLLAGRSILDAKLYYGFLMGAKISNDVWDLVKMEFTFFEGNDNLQGWLTRAPGRVAEILGIKINAGL
jgi:hypothetical protein